MVKVPPSCGQCPSAAAGAIDRAKTKDYNSTYQQSSEFHDKALLHKLKLVSETMNRYVSRRICNNLLLTISMVIVLFGRAICGAITALPFCGAYPRLSCCESGVETISYDANINRVKYTNYRRNVGSRASRKASPMKLMASTVTIIAKPGAIDMTGNMRINSLALLSMEPHSAVGGCAPSPR